MRVVIYGDNGGSGGYIRYCKGLLSSNSVPDDVEVWFVCSIPFYEKLGPLDIKIHVLTHPWISSKSRISRYLWYLWVYPRIIRKIKPSIEFYPSGQRRVYLREAKTVTTCHNLLLFDPKELEKIKDKKERYYFDIYKKNQEHSFQKSDGVIFLSRHSQEVVCGEVSGITQSTVIGHGLDSVFLFQKRSYNLYNKKIKLLYVSPYYNYKHQIEVIKAIQLLRERLGLDICLNFIGGGNSTYATEIRNYVDHEKIDAFILVNDKVEYKDLLNEYATSDIFIFASSCETFGITILEAMGARLPIACSNRTGLPEILKDAGVYFDPEDIENIADALKTLITDANLRELLAERAYKYALEYTWARCASETFNYIKQLEKN